jgi:hypothetical protein
MANAGDVLSTRNELDCRERLIPLYYKDNAAKGELGKV